MSTWFPTRLPIFTAALSLLTPVVNLAGELGNSETPMFADGFEAIPLTIINVDPPQVQQASGVSAQVHVNNLSNAPQSVTIRKPGEVEIEPGFQFDPAFPGGIELAIPAGLAPGNWSLEIQPSDGGSVAVLDDAFTTSDDISLAFDSAPAALSSTEGGVLQLTSVGAFINTPQVLLRPAAADVTVVAMPLQGVSFSSSSDITAIVAPGFTAGDYDVVVVNPDGTTGIVSAGLAISDQAPPKIDAIKPPAALYYDNAQFVVRGAGFDAGSSVALLCDGGNTSLPITEVGSANTLLISYLGDLPGATVCAVEVTNSDGQAVIWSGIHMQAGSSGFDAPTLVSPMLQARRSPALAMARLSGTHQRVYAIGGDDGDLDDVFATVEYADVSAFGHMGPWQASRVELPGPRTFAWATQFGRFLYLIGGNDGSSAVATIFRAEILGSETAPSVTRHRLSISPGAAGFGTSVRAYRIAPVFPADDPTNPSGVGASGPVFVTHVPVGMETIASIGWQAVPGAAAYRVFSQPPGVQWDGDPRSLELLAVASSNQFVDDGSAPTDPGIRPVETGETGQWHSVSGWNLVIARSHAAGALSPLPGRPDDVGLYVFGGLDSLGATLSSYSYSVLTNAAAATPSYGAWTTGVDSLGIAVSSSATWPVSSHSEDSHWIFVGTGLNSAATVESFIDRGTVAANGDLGTLAEMRRTRSVAGAIALTSYGEIGIAGGVGVLGDVDDSIRLSILAPGPELGSWNPSGSYTLSQPRSHAGSASGGPFIFIAGGSDSGGKALDIVERITR